LSTNGSAQCTTVFAAYHANRPAIRAADIGSFGSTKLDSHISTNEADKPADGSAIWRAVPSAELNAIVTAKLRTVRMS
jgi:hypothetical protein